MGVTDKNNCICVVNRDGVREMNIIMSLFLNKFVVITNCVSVVIKDRIWIIIIIILPHW